MVAGCDLTAIYFEYIIAFNSHCLMRYQHEWALPLIRENTLKITVLVENQASQGGMAAEKGLSLLIEDEESTVLFDTGKHDAFLTNAQRLGIDLRKLTHVVLSHGHYDHAGGLKALCDHLQAIDPQRRPLLVAHPDAFSRRGLYLNLFGKALRIRNLGAAIDKAHAEQAFRCALHCEPFWLHENLVFLGQIRRSETLGRARTFGAIVREDRLTKDLIVDDSALVYRTEKGLVILVGCSHSGICNIVEYARAVTGTRRVHAVIGGFHLRSASRRAIGEVAGFFSAAAIPIVHGCHCTGRATLRLPGQVDIETGSVIEIG